MNQYTPTPDDDAAMARAFNARWAEDVATIDPNLVAAWVEGTLGEEEAAIVESALAADGTLRRFVSELRQQGCPTPEAVNPALLQRLGLITEQQDDALSFARHARAASANRPWWIASGTAAALAIAFLGFWAGRLSATDNATAGSTFLATATFDVFADDDSTGNFSGDFLELELEGVNQ
jgi:anti-sigma-K factor RskA